MESSEPGIPNFSGLTFHGEIVLDEDSVAWLIDAIEKGFEPLFRIKLQ